MTNIEHAVRLGEADGKRVREKVRSAGGEPALATSLALIVLALLNSDVRWMVVVAGIGIVATVVRAVSWATYYVTLRVSAHDEISAMFRRVQK